MSHDTATEELDLAIPDMEGAAAQAQVSDLLRDVPGIVEMRVIERGAFVRYRPSAIDHNQICALIRKAGFRASTFQDSASGKTGISSQ
jgi:hypothetical protein